MSKPDLSKVPKSTPQNPVLQFRASTDEDLCPPPGLIAGYVDITFMLELITPQVADQYLQHNRRNRPMCPAHVNDYARLMRAGQFGIGLAQIVFYKNGDLADGQHTLAAIIKSRTTLVLTVVRGAPDDIVLAIDQGISRSVSDLSSSLYGEDGEFNSKYASVGKQMMRSIRQSAPNNPSKQDELAFCKKHYDAIEFAYTRLASRECHHAAIRAVVARAWYTQDRDRLNDFCDVMTTGEPNTDGDGAAIMLRDLYAAPKEKRLFGSGKGRNILYRKTEQALAAFLGRRNLEQLREIQKEAFPLPEETPII